MFGSTKEIIKEVKVLDDTRIKQLEADIHQLKAHHASEKRIIENEIVVKISQATADKEKENAKIREENSVLKKEVEILTKAFENMGFDVKDMKEILNKLVDGLISKNQIHLVK